LQRISRTITLILYMQWLISYAVLMHFVVTSFVHISSSIHKQFATNISPNIRISVWLANENIFHYLYYRLFSLKKHVKTCSEISHNVARSVSHQLPINCQSTAESLMNGTQLRWHSFIFFHKIFGYHTQWATSFIATYATCGFATLVTHGMW
jgi:hypothetical protein